MEATPIQEEVAFKTTIRASEAREALWGSYYRRRFLGLLVFLVVLCLVLVTAFARRNDDSYFAWTLLSSGLSILLFIGACYVIAIFAHGYSVARCSRGHNGNAWRVTDEGAEVEEGNTTLSFKWAAFEGFIETKTLILMRRQKTRYLIIPKRCLTPTEIQGLLAILSSKVPKLTT